MGKIKDLGEKAFRDYVTDGVPSSGINYPNKSEIRSVFHEIDASIEKLEVSGDTVTKATWAQLSTVTGSRDGQRGYVEADSGTHTDPIVGGIVQNEGIYTWSMSPAGWRWLTAGSTEDSLTVNRGRVFPNRVMTRNGYTSAGNGFLLSGILGARVIGAEHGKYYSIHFQRNGAALTGAVSDYAWIIRSYPIEGFESSTENNRVVNFIDPAPDIDLTAGIQTLRVVSPRVPGLEFYITVDPAYLPPFGTRALNALQDDAVGASWIIDPANYFYADAPATIGGSGALKFNISSTGIVSADWRSGDYLYRIHFGPNGFNDLPNLIGVDFAPYSPSPVWTTINSAATDWLPPMTVEAVSGGNPSLPMIYTGGNHGSDGGAGGKQTARNIFYAILIDGQPQSISAAVGSCSKISLIILNELMAYNTVDTGRYVLSQTFKVDISPGGIEVHAEIKAYENVIIKRDNGPQCVSLGFQGTQIIYGGQTIDRVPFDSNADSGAKLAYPNAWALVLQSENGQQASWMDRSYEAGDGRYVGEGQPYLRGGGATNTKWYHAAIAGMGSGVTFTAGERYRWRGGYSWQAPDLQPAGYDSVLWIKKSGSDLVALARSANDITVLEG